MNVSYISYIIESAKIIQNYSLFFCITLVIPVRCRRRRNEICVVNIRLGERGGGGCPENWFRSESGFGLGLALELGLGEFSSGAIFLEPIGVNGFHFLYFFCIAITWYLNMTLLSSCFAITFSYCGSCLGSNTKVLPKSSSSLAPFKTDRGFSFLSLTIFYVFQ